MSKKRNINNNQTSTVMDTIKDLKDVFGGVATLLYQKNLTITKENDAFSVALDPEYELPVKIDTLNYEEGDPDIQHYQVINLPGDWFTSATMGTLDFGFRVPTKHTKVLKLAFGEDSVKVATATMNSANYSGHALSRKTYKVEGAWILVDDTKTKLLIINNTTMFAKQVLDGDAKGVYAIDFNGTQTSDGETPDVLFLTKQS